MMRINFGKCFISVNRILKVCVEREREGERGFIYFYVYLIVCFIVTVVIILVRRVEYFLSVFNIIILKDDKVVVILIGLKFGKD